MQWVQQWVGVSHSEAVASVRVMSSILSTTVAYYAAVSEAGKVVLEITRAALQVRLRLRLRGESGVRWMGQPREMGRFGV